LIILVLNICSLYYVRIICHGWSGQGRLRNALSLYDDRGYYEVVNDDPDEDERVNDEREDYQKEHNDEG
jgi:hypothetical protein